MTKIEVRVIDSFEVGACLVAEYDKDDKEFLDLLLKVQENPKMRLTVYTEDDRIICCAEEAA